MSQASLGSSPPPVGVADDVAERRKRRTARPVVFPEVPAPAGLHTPTQAPEGTRLSNRVINMAVAAVALVVAAPAMLVIAGLIRATSPGPAIFRQERVGLDRRDLSQRRPSHPGRQRDLGGRIFTIYKFRTMRTDADSVGEVWASHDDPRVTKIGAFLRATRLDELPQFLNVLKGDMNVVGPRPEQPSIFAKLSEELDGYRGRQRVLPGITGLAQVKLGYDTTVEAAARKNRLDLWYIKKRSVPLDLTIMAQTVPVMLGRKVWSSSSLDAMVPGLAPDFVAAKAETTEVGDLSANHEESDSGEGDSDAPPPDGVSAQA